MSETQTETQTETPTTPNIAERKIAEVGYFDGELKRIAFNDGDAVKVLINKSELDFGDGQSINDDEGNEVSPTDTATAGKVYYIVGNYKQGH